MKKLPPFFVVGSDRSGTTLLRLMLNEHSALHVPRETLFLIDLFNKLPLTKRLTVEERQTAYEIIIKNERWKDLEIKDNELLEKLQLIDHPSIRDIIETVFQISAAHAGKSYWGDKTPDYVKEIERIHIVFPEARFIHVIRDGRDVCLSLLQTRWVGTWVPNIARYWKSCVQEGITAGRALPSDLYMEIKYEDLVQSPVAVLTDICNFLGVEFEKPMLTFYESAAKNIAPWEYKLHKKTMRPPTVNDINRWKREASPMLIAGFEAIAGDAMKEAGQDLHYRGAKRIIPISLAILEKQLRFVLKIRRKILNKFSSISQYSNKKNQQLS